MEIYITVRDPAEGGMSQVIGGFSTEDKARAAAQEIEDDDTRDLPDDHASARLAPLTWEGTSAEAPDGDSYDVVLVELDIISG